MPGSCRLLGCLYREFPLRRLTATAPLTNLPQSPPPPTCCYPTFITGKCKWRRPSQRVSRRLQISDAELLRLLCLKTSDHSLPFQASGSQALTWHWVCLANRTTSSAAPSAGRRCPRANKVIQNKEMEYNGHSSKIHSMPLVLVNKNVNQGPSELPTCASVSL